MGSRDRGLDDGLECDLACEVLLGRREERVVRCEIADVVI